MDSKRAGGFLKRPVVLFVATGNESDLDVGEGPAHRASALNLMREAQKKGFQVVLTNDSSKFKERADGAGVQTDKIIFLGRDWTLRTCDVYDALHEVGIHPPVVVVAGHFRDACEGNAMHTLLRMEYRDGSRVPGITPNVKYIVGPASMSLQKDFSRGGGWRRMTKLHQKGVEPITMQQFRAMDKRGRIPKKLQKIYFRRDITIAPKMFRTRRSPHRLQR